MCVSVLQWTGCAELFVLSSNRFMFTLCLLACAVLLLCAAVGVLW